MENKIKVLDCTLRDGGYVNNFNFGKKNIPKIVTGLSKSGSDIIELGFLRDGEHNENQSLFNNVASAEKIISETIIDQEFCLMIRPDWFTISNLEHCSGKIKTLRFAFHYKDINLALLQAEKAKKLGYSVFLNPVNITSYSEEMLENLLIELNDFNPTGICIVDTFGSLLPQDLRSILSIFMSKININITIGLHLHENLSISMALASIFLELIEDDRNVVIDSSLLGMGRVPGNLPTELIMNFLNKAHNKKYELINVYDLISSQIQKIRSKVAWGYMPTYAITAFEKTHRDYAEFLLAKKDLNIPDISGILDQITKVQDKNFYNKKLIIELYEKYTQKSR